MIRRKFLLAAGSGVIAAAAGIAAGGIAFVATRVARSADRFRSGVIFDGEGLVGLTFAEALARADLRWGPYAQSPIILRLGQRTWSPTGADLGVTVDWLTPLREAYAWGRDEGLTEQLRGTATSGSPSPWHTVVTLDQRVFAAYLERVAASVEREPVDSVLRVEYQVGRPRLIIDPSASGLQLAPAGYAEVVAANLRPPARLVVDLASELIPPTVDEQQLRGIAEEAERLLDGHISLNSQVADWAIAREMLVSGVTLGGTEAAPDVRFRLDYSSFARLAKQIADEVRISPVEPRIRVNASGEIVPVVEGREGRQVDAEQLWARVQAAFAAGDSAINVPIVALEPDISRLSISELQFGNVIAVGESFFRGSDEKRVQNIDNGSGLIDGTVVAPGESISVNRIVGPITTANGFVEGLVIAPTRTEPGVGGGICQVSTTLFRALFWAGLPILERWQHVYRVRYYELGKEGAEGHHPGFDAAIWQPSQDLRAINDTPNYLLIRREFSAAAQSLRFVIKGAPIGRRVEIDSWQGPAVEPPPVKVEPNPELEPGEVKQTDNSIEGMQAVIYRRVYMGGQALFKDQFVSEFVAWPERWEIGPNEDGSVPPVG